MVRLAEQSIASAWGESCWKISRLRRSEDPRDLNQPTRFDLDFLGEKLVDAEETGPTGKLPINPSGGFQSFGEATTAQGVWQVCELTKQLRGECGSRQVPGANVGLAQTLGLGGNATAVVMRS